MLHRRLANIPCLGRALVGCGVPFETPLAGVKEGREAEAKGVTVGQLWGTRRDIRR